jgi:Lrp/AsnC family transcriptional regulator for asnA, asnC and gidA
VDELDREIVAILQSNGRASNAWIARRIGVSEGTVRRRLKKLMADGVIDIVAVVDAEHLGYDTEALVGVQVDPDKVMEVARSLGELPESNWVAITTGTYDVFMWVTLQSADQLGTFLREKLGVIAGVRRTETFVRLALPKKSASVEF